MELDWLALPHTIPGLLRECSPIVDMRFGRRWETGLVIGFVTEGGEPIYFFGWDQSEPEVPHLDLVNATGRGHATDWAAVRLGRKPHHGPATFDLWPGLFALSWQDTDRDRRMEIAVWWQDDGCDDFEQSVMVDSLRELDLDDERALPDGSLWVVGEGLRRFVLHLSGRADG